jgi:glycerophosphoryl diester phosphodiesterase
MFDNAWRRVGRPLTIAHRGHSIEFPENTHEAYRRAIELGVEMIECDVNITRDGHLVMMHDWKLDRTTNGAGRVSQATLEEIQRLEAGLHLGPQFAGVRVPTTESTLRLYREAGIYGCFEVKGADDAEAQRIAVALAEMIVRLDALDYAFMSAYSHAALAAARAHVPELMIAPERLPDDAPPDAPEAVRQAQALGAPVLQHEYSVLTPEVVAALHAAGIAVWAWSTTGEQSLIDMINVGADGLMGDDVRTMIAVLDRMRPLAAAPAT